MQQVGRSNGNDLIPPHVWHGKVFGASKFAHTAGQQAQAGNIAFFGRFEHELHAHADPEQRLPELCDVIGEAGVLQPCHAVRGRTDAGENDMRGIAQPLLVDGQLGLHPQALDGIL